MATEEKREKFSSRIGFLLIAAGCAVGLGNVWRFPYITGQCGGALFVLVFLAFLILLGLPYLMIEIAVGRASRKSLSEAFDVLGEKGNGWRRNKYWMIAANYILMSFYGLVTGWLCYYAAKFAVGGFGEGLTEEKAGETFGALLADPGTMTFYMIICSLIAFVVELGVVKGVERITKPLMFLLLVLLVGMAVNAAFMDGFAEGMSYYLVPDFSRIEKVGLMEIIWSAMSHAFFTLSIGIGAIEIFGTYADKDHSIVSEAIWIAVLDTIVALQAGVVIFPACFTYGVEPSAGSGLLFVTLTTVFSNIVGGKILGTVFFIFMLFAAMTTLITIYENIIMMCMELFGFSRRKSTIINFLVVTVLSMPVVLGFNVLDFIHPLGDESCILDLQDFLVSNNFLPLGSVVFVLFITARNGMQWKNFVAEVNTGAGLKLSPKLFWYFRYVLPLAIAIVLIAGYLQIFMK